MVYLNFTDTWYAGLYSANLNNKAKGLSKIPEIYVSYASSNIYRDFFEIGVW